MLNRITNEPILTLQENEIAVVGTNEGGRHGAGFALYCYNYFGAVYGQAFGLQGQCFGVPTRDNSRPLKTLPLDQIEPYINEFIQFAKDNESLTFKVSKIGCGHAGYTVEQIAPMFKEAINVKNIHLPREFWDVLNQ